MLQARLPSAEVIPIDSLLAYINAPAGRFDAEGVFQEKARLLDQGRRRTARTGAALVGRQKCPRLVEMKVMATERDRRDALDER
jgi:hypothetical protein